MIKADLIQVFDIGRGWFVSQRSYIHGESTLDYYSPLPERGARDSLASHGKGKKQLTLLTFHRFTLGLGDVDKIQSLMDSLSFFWRDRQLHAATQLLLLMWAT